MGLKTHARTEVDLLVTASMHLCGELDALFEDEGLPGISFQEIVRVLGDGTDDDERITSALLDLQSLEDEQSLDLFVDRLLKTFPLNQNDGCHWAKCSRNENLRGNKGQRLADLRSKTKPKLAGIKNSGTTKTPDFVLDKKGHLSARIEGSVWYFLPSFKQSIEDT